MSWGLPVRGGYRTSAYGPRSSPGGVGSTWHRGVDVGGRATDWLVRSVGPGYVLARGTNAVRGRWVAVRHDDGTTTTYQHLDRVDASGAVQAGDLLGVMGTSGTSTARHLHLEAFPAGRFVRVGDAWASTGRAIDPEPYLRARGVDLAAGVVTVVSGGPATPGGHGALPVVPTAGPLTPLIPIPQEDDMLIVDAGVAGSYLLSGGRLLGLDAAARASLVADGVDAVTVSRERYLDWIAGTGDGVLIVNPSGAYQVSTPTGAPFEWVPSMAQVDEYRARGIRVVPVTQAVYDALTQRA